MFFLRQSKKKSSSHSLFYLTEDRAIAHLEKCPGYEAEEMFDPASVDEAPASTPFLGLRIADRRFRVTFFLLSLFFLFLGIRVSYLQIIQGDTYRKMAEGNRIRSEYLPSARGIIQDRFGRMLVENVPAFTLVMRIGDLPTDHSQREILFDKVADLAGLQRTDLDLLLQEYAAVSPEENIIVCKDLFYDQAMHFMISEQQTPGFFVRVLTKRHYPSDTPSLSHVLGYVGKISADEFFERQDKGYHRTDEIGKTGVESSMETLLRGQYGKKRMEVNAFGQETAVLSEEIPLEGKPVTLSIDLEFQSMIEQRFRTSLETLGLRQGSIVVVDPRNGEILALVSLPSFDSNLFAGGIQTDVYQALEADVSDPLFPRAIAGTFPSGSTFKPFVAAAALAEGIITPSTSFVSVGGISIGPWVFPDWKAGGHGVTDIRKALADSVNTFFYIIGGGYNTFIGLGVERIVAYARVFGFGSKTGIDLPSEAEGFLPSKEWKEKGKGERWYVGDTYHLAIGQGDLLVTPLQLAVASATVANGGTRWTPHVVHAIDENLVEPEGIILSDQLQQALKIVQEGMRQAVTRGSAKSLSTLPFAVAGKTGTAQVAGGKQTHAWFVGFGPYEDPQIVVTVLVENGGEGSSVAVPIAKDIFFWWYNHRFSSSPVP
ncbi:MAG: Penicillin-binding protein 2 [Candidatus Uhrbacteria bacterium GW2011_GWF2_41_16]|uniref:Penicillin-binding protein 2 n=2 Tax=Candidatus Uhriibacteriota TaxID=1752732 RepID=A0A0G0V849_9BACT|nr:MAG: Penicillin-binding protein 2 [Candidatus Uhrbacteria bacterium GW2011_GWA2_41_10]KKR86050.1 MAG: Penicillin-binding protein 2 [Candidatus Uhrbacteria bacterium GW2011_GWC2_41_11]KKR97104.1 MAG: Penicillin-binding protein 2 [Candidatus Uhrbacteria bacterium GW2011_GWF2_41_16]